MTTVERSGAIGYVPAAGEERLFAIAAQAGAPVLLLGPTGCGKTQLVEHMAARLDRPLVTVTCHDDMTTADLVGRHLIRGGDVEWRDGPLTRAMRDGAVCYLDEVVEARSDTLAVLHSVADHRRTLYVDRTGEELVAAAGFVLVASYNPRALGSPKALRPSLRQRFVTLRMGYLAPEVERALVAARTGVDDTVATRLVAVAAPLRDAAERDRNGRFDPPSTRTLISAAGLVAGGASVEEAVAIAIVGPLGTDAGVELALRELVHATLTPDGGG